MATDSVYLRAEVDAAATERVDKAESRFYKAVEELDEAKSELRAAVHALRNSVMVRPVQIKVGEE